jgi:hypothetical protein
VKLTQVSSKQLQGSPDFVRDTLVSFIEQVAFILNGNVDVLDNLKIDLVEAQFNFPPGAEADIRHKLGRKARGYIVVRASRALFLFDGATDWNDKSIFLKATSFGNVTLLVF